MRGSLSSVRKRLKNVYKSILILYNIFILFLEREILDDRKVKSVLRDNGFHFKKKFGQNFLSDSALLNEIVRLSGVTANDTVVEIGCGAGTLTRALAQTAKKVVSFEVDLALKPVLESTLAGLDNVSVVFKDFLKVNMTDFEREIKDYHVVANLPYYITTPLIMKLIEEGNGCKSLSVMVQKEVAMRFTAKENTPEYGAITAILALVGDCETVLEVPREKFTPSPNVDSAVVKITLFRNRLGNVDETLYKKTVHAAFASRRKTLENNIVNAFNFTRVQAKEILESCNISPSARGETLSPQQFVVLSESIKKYLK